MNRSLFDEKFAANSRRMELYKKFCPHFFDEKIKDYVDNTLITNHGSKINFCTYSYLNLIHHPEIKEFQKWAIDHYGAGTHGVRLLGGTLDIHRDLELEIAQFFARDDAITFSSGYLTNMSVIDCLLDEGDVVLVDMASHASIMDGSRISKASVRPFRHNDMEHLRRRLSTLESGIKKLIVVDAVYSMDGDMAPLAELLEIRDEFDNVLLMVDEAHSLGVLGESGRGIEEETGLWGSCDILMGSLAKTIPGQGGYVTGEQSLIDYLRYQARGYIFSSALPPSSAASALAGFRILSREGRVRKARLKEKCDFFLKELDRYGFDIAETCSAVIPVMVRDERLTFELAGSCHEQGYYVMPVISPAVPRRKERLRVNIHCDQNDEDLRTFVFNLAELFERSGIVVESKERFSLSLRQQRREKRA